MDSSNLTNKEFFIRNELESVLILRIGQGFISIQTLESGKTSFTFLLFNPSEEMIKSIVNSLGNILFDLSINRNINIFCNFIQVKLSNISFVSFVSINFSLKKFVIDQTAIRKSFVKFDSLSSRRINTILKIHLRRHKLFKETNYLNLTRF
jgi:hypothetical protein